MLEGLSAHNVDRSIHLDKQADGRNRFAPEGLKKIEEAANA